MNKISMGLLVLFLVFGMVLYAPFVLGHDDPYDPDHTHEDDSDNSGSGSSDDENDSNSGSNSDDDSDIEIRIDNSGSGSSDDEDELEIEVEDDGDRRRIKIRAEGIDAESVREAIRDRNRLHFDSSDLPENCSRTGSVIRCEIDAKERINVEAESDIELSNVTKTLIRELAASLRNSDQEKIEIEIKGKKDNGEVEVETEIEGSLNSEQQEALDALVAAITMELENSDREEAEIEIRMRRDFREAKIMIIEAGQSGNIIIKIRDSEFRTRVELYHHNGEVYGVFGDNETRLIDILPDELQERIRERIRARLEIRNESIELNEEGEYEFEADKDARFLGIIKIKERIRFHVDPETGEILNQRAPWWGFLATDEETEEEQEDVSGTTELIISLSEQSNSGESGTALLVEDDGKVTVTLSITGFFQDVSQPAHIHVGVCPDVGSIAYPLENVLNGHSETTLDVTLEQLQSELPLGINVHRSVEEASVYTSCGDIEF